MMDAAEAAGTPLVMVFSDETRFSMESDRRRVRHRRD
jgi:hypothetical protein